MNSYTLLFVYLCIRKLLDGLVDPNMMPYNQQCNVHDPYPHNRNGRGKISDANVITDINWFKINVISIIALPACVRNKENHPGCLGCLQVRNEQCWSSLSSIVIESRESKNHHLDWRMQSWDICKSVCLKVLNHKYKTHFQHSDPK